MARSSSGPPDGADATSASPSGETRWQRLSAPFLRPPKLDKTPAAPKEPDYARLTDDEKRQRIVTVDPIERKIGMAAAAFTAVLAVIETVPYMLNKTVVATTTKPVGHHCPNGLTYVTHGSSAATCNGVYPASHYAFPLVVWLVLALAIFVTARIGRRSAVAFSTALTGISFGTVFMVPFIVVAGWIMLRSWRTQKYGAPNAKTVRPGYTPPPRGSTRGTRPSRRKKGDTDETRPNGRKPPEANKRYTPKTPPKPQKKGTAASAKKSAASSKKPAAGR